MMMMMMMMMIKITVAVFGHDSEYDWCVRSEISGDFWASVFSNVIL
jgi:hypothetical protein